MATKTSPSSRRTASRTSASRKASSSGRKAAPKKKPAPKKPAARKKPARASTRQILSPFARDAVGIALVVFAGLAVLSVWFDLAGPMGQAMTDLLQSGFGLLAVAIPVIGVFWGFVLLRDVAPEDRVRMFIGFGLLTVGVLGMLSIARGNPGVFAPLEDTRRAAGLGDAGGIIGAIGAGPLSKVVSPYGAFVIDAGLAAIGLLIFTGTSFAEAKQKVSDFRSSLVEKDEVAKTAK